MPVRYQVIMTPRAELDLDDIYNFIAKDSPPNAEKFVSLLIGSIHDLHTMPNRYGIYQGRRRSKRAIRRMAIKLYLVYYRVDDARRSVEIITIRHGMRRQPRRFARR
jgi:toxin ParE1/3/4